MALFLWKAHHGTRCTFLRTDTTALVAESAVTFLAVRLKGLALARHCSHCLAWQLFLLQSALLARATRLDRIQRVCACTFRSALRFLQKARHSIEWHAFYLLGITIIMCRFLKTAEQIYIIIIMYNYIYRIARKKCEKNILQFEQNISFAYRVRF